MPPLLDFTRQIHLIPSLTIRTITKTTAIDITNPTSNTAVTAVVAGSSSCITATTASATPSRPSILFIDWQAFIYQHQGFRLLTVVVVDIMEVSMVVQIFLQKDPKYFYRKTMVWHMVMAMVMGMALLQPKTAPSINTNNTNTNTSLITTERWWLMWRV
jgi:hypothetical protein